MALVLDWQKKLGYSQNPFEGTFTPVKHYLAGVKELQERLNLFIIKEDRFGTISGEPGTGKTMLLRWMNDELAPQKSHVQHLLDAKTLKRPEIVAALLEARLSFLSLAFGKVRRSSAEEREKTLLQLLAKEKKNILLIDNGGELGAPELALLAEVCAKTPTYVLVADTKENLKRLVLPEGLHDALKLEMPKYTDEALTEMLHRRIVAAGSHGTHPFDEYELKGLCKKASHNPVKFLQLAQERAIELSLKVTHEEHRAPAQPTKLFSIKIEKPGQKEAAHAAKPTHTEAKVEERKPAQPPAEGADLSALAQAVPLDDAHTTAPKAAAQHHAPAQEDIATPEEMPAHLIEEVITKIPAKAKHKAAHKRAAQRTGAHKKTAQKKVAKR